MTNTKTLQELIEEINGTEVPTAEQVDNLKTAISATNKVLIEDALFKLALLGQTDRDGMFKEFIANPTTQVYRLHIDKVTGEYELRDKTTFLSFTQLEHLLRKITGEHHADGTVTLNYKATFANTLRYGGMIAYFLDNVMHNIRRDIESKTDAVPSRQKTVVIEDTDCDFTGDSNAKLQEQLNAIAKAILPESIYTRPLEKKDVRAIIHASKKAYGLDFRMCNEKAMTDLIFASFKTRLQDNGDYKITSSAKIHKESKKND